MEGFWRQLYYPTFDDEERKKQLEYQYVLWRDIDDLTIKDQIYVKGVYKPVGQKVKAVIEENQDPNVGWTSLIDFNTMQTYLASANNGAGVGQNIVPVTPGAGMAKTDALPSDTNGLDFRSNPIPGKGPYSKWNRANANNYVVIPLEVRYKVGDENVAGKEVYLSDLTLEKRTGDTHSDISDALRFHVSATTPAQSANSTPASTINRLISKTGGTTVTHGALDLDGDGNPDKAYGENDKYGFKGTQLTEVAYGDTVDQESFSNAYIDANNVNSMIAQPSAEDEFDLIDDTLTYGTGENIESKSIGTTVAETDGYLNVNITIWVEGWQKFGESGHESAIWDNGFINASFQVGFEFAVNAEIDA